MKKKITLLGFFVLMMVAVFITAFAQKEKNKQNQKEQQHNKGNRQDKTGKAINGRDDNKGPQNEKREQNDNHENKGNNNNKDHNEARGNKGQHEDMNHSNNGKHDDKDGYSWNPETFKNRNKIKNQEKVTLCHKFNSDREPVVTLRVSANALKAHMNHGDVIGDCPAINDSRYSDFFLRNRTDYYNGLQNSREQVLYSRSILDYALARLANSRLQLANLQNNNMPAADIERKQATVMEMEQNVSLLETLIGVTDKLVANKF